MPAYRRALSLSPGLPAARMGLDAILERARTPRPNEQLVAFLLDSYADDGANWEQLEREKSNLFPGYAFVCQND
jgi:hypothetical protein